MSCACVCVLVLTQTKEVKVQLDELLDRKGLPPVAAPTAVSVLTVFRSRGNYSA